MKDDEKLMRERKALKLKSASKQHFDKVALNHEVVEEAVKCYEPTLSMIKNLMKGGGVIADIGCGTGGMLNILARELPEVKLYGVDISPQSIAYTRRTVPSAELFEGDGEDIPLPDGAVDVVLCMHCFHHFPNPGRALREMNRITSCGGSVIIVENDHPFIFRLRKYFKFRRRKYDHGDVRFYSRKKLVSMMRRFGWYGLTVQPIADHSMLVTGRKQGNQSS